MLGVKTQSMDCAAQIMDPYLCEQSMDCALLVYMYVSIACTSLVMLECDCVIHAQ